MRPVAWLVVAALVSTATATDAAADEPDDTQSVVAIGAGAGVMFASAAAGISIVGADAHRDGKDFALVGAQTGMILGPILAHGVVDEWTRGLWFSIPGGLAALGTLGIVQAYPDIVKRGPPDLQYALSATLFLSIFGNTIGVVDAAFAPGRKARATKSSSSIWLAPTFGGAMLMGTL